MVRNGMHETVESAPAVRSPAAAWSRALELTAPIAKQPERTLYSVIKAIADVQGDAPALIGDRQSLTYHELMNRANRYARWALELGLMKGDSVCLLMPNQPDYMAIWLGITSVGASVALLNTNLGGASLAHCIDIVEPKQIIVAGDLVDRFRSARSHLGGLATAWIHGNVHDQFASVDRAVEGFRGDALSETERRGVTIEDLALYIYTSGTTGLPKAARISHARLMQWSHWFAGLMDIGRNDRMFNCLPMYHSVGGVLATGAVLVGGGSVVIRERFSTRKTWSEVRRSGCTLFQYIGELCRFLLHAEPDPHEQEHSIRTCCGNGLRPDVWEAFRQRYRVPQILEFYAATEGNVSLFNVEGKPGAIGRIPSYLAPRLGTALIRFDLDREEPIRNDAGFCERCGPNEVGEAIGRLLEDRTNIGARFDGYTSQESTEKKVLRNVFKPGDAWFRTGDLMRKDEQGFFYFVDRIGDTFRWKGENVATSEVAEAMCGFPGIQQANVYGVAVPGADGRAGMATLVTDHSLDLTRLRAYLIERLPPYARPLFLRIRREIQLTGTFKFLKSELVRDAFDPKAISDPLFFDSPEESAFVPVDQATYDRICNGGIRF